MAKPYDVNARMNFFVDLKLPQSVARLEQIQIRAVLHNYGDHSLHVVDFSLLDSGNGSLLAYNLNQDRLYWPQFKQTRNVLL